MNVKNWETNIFSPSGGTLSNSCQTRLILVKVLDVGIILFLHNLPGFHICATNPASGFSLRMLRWHLLFYVWPFLESVSAGGKEKMIYTYTGDILVNFLGAFNINHSQSVKTNVPFFGWGEETITLEFL